MNWHLSDSTLISLINNLPLIDVWRQISTVIISRIHELIGLNCRRIIAILIKLIHMLNVNINQSELGNIMTHHTAMISIYNADLSWYHGQNWLIVSGSTICGCWNHHWNDVWIVLCFSDDLLMNRLPTAAISDSCAATRVSLYQKIDRHVPSIGADISHHEGYYQN